MSRLRITLAIVSASALLGIGCSDDTPAAPTNNSNSIVSEPDVGRDVGEEVDLGGEEVGELAQILISPDPALVSVDDTLRLSAEGSDSDGERAPTPLLMWSVADDAVAEITEDGVVIARAIGSTTVSARSGDIVGSVELRVIGNPVARVEVRPSTGTLNIGETAQLVVDLFDSGNQAIEDARQVEFTSSDDAVLTVDGAGLVTARGEGTAVVSVEVEGVIENATFSVDDFELESIDVRPNMVVVAEGGSVSLSVMFGWAGAIPAQPPVITWTSDSVGIATVDAAGVVQGVSAGDAIITATVGALSDQVNVTVNGANSFSSVSAGSAHACGVYGTSIVCWGANGAGQLGHSATGPSTVVTARPFSKVAAGGQHTCGLTIDGDVLCWGSNSHEQLGSAGGGVVPNPVTIGGLRFVDVAAGQRHSCAVTDSNKLYCWGDNSSGQIGVNGSTSTPTLVGDFQLPSLGESHTCAIRGSAAYCWGANGDGRLGLNTTSQSVGAPTAVTGGYAFASVSAGTTHSCGITTNGALSCWGANTNGEVGDGTTVQRITPILIGTPVPIPRIGAGQNHTCGTAGNGSLYCWGLPGSGALAQAAATVVNTPTLSTTMPLFGQVSSGDGFSCALASGGLVYCWGEGSSGQLGGTSDSTMPLQIEPI